MSIQTEEISRAYICIESGKMQEAEEIYKELLSEDLGNRIISGSLTWCNYWKEKIQNLGDFSTYEQGEYLLSCWKQFELMVKTRSKSEYDEKIIYSFKKGIFSMALELYINELQKQEGQGKWEEYRKAGFCYKKLGSYENAMECLMNAARYASGNPTVMAELADCYALCGDEKMAKAMFREAFFIDPLKIDLWYLEAPLIKVLVNEVQQKGYEGNELLSWIPVYGKLLGIFNVQRQLRAQEAGKIRQEIFARQNELKDKTNKEEIIKPRLLNLYFWIIDYMLSTHDSLRNIQQMHLEIKLLDKTVYNLYTQNN